MQDTLRDFFYSRGIDYSNKVDTVFKSSNAAGEDLFVLNYKKVRFQFKSSIIRIHKMRIKAILKTSFNLTIPLLLKSINREINIWNSFYSKLIFFENNFKLDLYVYRLLWKFLKRIHPRRTNTWIYSKYWGTFSRH